tara:strand:- start:50 stop:367 length:318 start_codon:yes stop_codon:yes gene_type:complete
MLIYPFIIISHKLEHYYEDHDYCEKHKNQTDALYPIHSCRNITFPNCVFDIIIHIFTLKIFIEFLFMRITNSINFIAKYNEVIRVLPYSDDEEVKPDEITEIEDL